MTPFANHDERRDFVRRRNERILAQIKEGKRIPALAREHEISDSLIHQVIKRAGLDEERRNNWGDLSVRAVNVLQKRFGFHRLQDFLAAQMTEEKFLLAKGVGFKLLQEVERATGKFSPSEGKTQLGEISHLTPSTREKSSEEESLRREVDRLRRENEELRRRLAPTPDILPEPPLPLLPSDSLPQLTATSPPKDKISLFRTLFKGREDVYPVFWISATTGKKGYSPACEDPWAGKGKPRKYLPLTDEAVQDHLTGKKTLGVYPLLPESTCWFLACDFDKDGWVLDALAYVTAARRHGIPVYLERSRSGNGGHVWIFFAQTVSATSARQLGMRLLRDAMEVRGELDLGSYDRFFPNQDFMPKSGFGNLIALPLQFKRRSEGNTEFLNVDDPALKPFPDQWAFLSKVRRLTTAQLSGLLEKLPRIAAGPGEATRVSEEVRRKHSAPPEARVTWGAMVAVEKSGLPPWLLSRIKHLASLHNPLFYERQNRRFSTFDTPAFIRCYEEDMAHLYLPRGLFEEFKTLMESNGCQLVITDDHPIHAPLGFKFLGALSPIQEKAVQDLMAEDLGVLVAPPGSGKTVMGCAVIARRNVPALVLAHRKPILDQWRKQLTVLLGLKPRDIGQVGGGRRRQSGIVDLGMIQSLKRTETEFFSRYGLLVVDECHHVPAVTFDLRLRRANVRSVLGLTATPERRDGLHDLITMQCGPIRHRMREARSDLDKRLFLRETDFTWASKEALAIQEVFRGLVNDEVRNRQIVEDILKALEGGRRCLVLSQWKEHVRWFERALKEKGRTPFVLSGELGKKERAAILRAIQEKPPSEELLVISTGQYLGEGFDCPKLDTLFLAFPVSFRGKLTQYVGRVLRDFEGKDSAWVYDYVDTRVPVLQRMWSRRRKTYKSLGFDPQEKGRRLL